MFASINENLKLIGRFGRRFLLFNAFNAIAWQCLVGSVLVLFARHIGMPARWVGLLLSFIPLSMVFAFASVPLEHRLGARRLMIYCWLLRMLATTPVLLIPWAMRHWGMMAGWLVLCATTLTFSFIRGLGLAGWYPWLHEMLPNAARGRYFSLEQVLYQLINIVMAFVIGIILGTHATLSRFLSVQGVGMFCGLLSVILITRIPGGRKPERSDFHASKPTPFHAVLQDRRYMRFILAGALGITATAWLTSANVLYLRDVLHYSSRKIMFLLGIGGVGVASSVVRWGRFADEEGSGRAMALTLVGFSASALLWVVLAPKAIWTGVLVWPATGATLIFMAAFQMAAQRGMLFQVPTKGRATYTSIWNIANALAVGVTPILVGQIIDHFGITGYRFCFSMAGIAGVASAMLCRRIREDAQRPLSYRAVFSVPARPFVIMSDIALITLGRHRSRRSSAHSLPPKNIVEDVIKAPAGQNDL